MNRPSYKELWLYERKDRDEQLQWIRDAVDGNAKFRNSEPPYSEEEELARKIMQMHARIAELEAAQRWIPVPQSPEVQESEATSCKFCGSNKSDRRMNSIVCSSCGRKIGNVAPPEVQA